MTEKNGEERKIWKGNLKKITLIMIITAIGVSTFWGLTGCEKKTKEVSSQNSTIIAESLDKNEKKADSKKEDDKKVETNVDQVKHAIAQPTNTNSNIGKNINVPPAVKPSDSDNYFKDALFIGDSRMRGFMLYSGVEATGYTESGLDVNTVLTKPFIRYNGNHLTLQQALEISQFGKIYIKLGMNELGWVYTDKFISQYAAVIDKLKELQPNAVIYVEAILPVTASRDSKGTYINNKHIAEYNALISKMATEKGVNFIDASSAVSDENGFLYEEATTDGVHLNKKYCQLWYQYLLDHK